MGPLSLFCQWGSSFHGEPGSGPCLIWVETLGYPRWRRLKAQSPPALLCAGLPRSRRLTWRDVFADCLRPAHSTHDTRPVDTHRAELPLGRLMSGMTAGSRWKLPEQRNWPPQLAGHPTTYYPCAMHPHPPTSPQPPLRPAAQRHMLCNHAAFLSPPGQPIATAEHTALQKQHPRVRGCAQAGWRAVHLHTQYMSEHGEAEFHDEIRASPKHLSAPDRMTAAEI